MATPVSPLADFQGLANAPGWLDAFWHPGHVELAPESPVVLLEEVRRGVLGRHRDVAHVLPGILLALAMMIVLGANKSGLVLALGLAYIPSVARVVRGTVLSIREKEYIEASRVIGNSELYSMVRHVLPNAVAPVAVLATSMFGWVLLAESALSFLGLGVPPPAPTWGNMLAASRPYMETAAWLSIAPGLSIALTLLGINLLGDSLRDLLDPRMAHG